MKVVVGLGNPGPRYARTRHNIGFDVLSCFANKHAFPASKLKFDALLTECQVFGEKIVLLTPQTYMNASGRSVRQCIDFFKLELNEMIIVVDDMNLDLGRLRLRGSGSSGGQKGLADIIRVVGTEAIPRLRFGIGRPQGRMDPSDFVLQRFTDTENKAVEISIEDAIAGLEIWIKNGISAAMNATNSQPE